MARFFDPTPIVERAMPLTRGIARSSGMHGASIQAVWNGKQISVVVKGFGISDEDEISVVGIHSRFFAMKASGGYDSGEKRLLRSWAQKAIFSAAIRKLMDQNPKKCKYELDQVQSYSAGDKTASTPRGIVLPVRFGSMPGRVVAGELGLICNIGVRHFVGGEALTPTGETFSFVRYSGGPATFSFAKYGEITYTTIAELGNDTAIIGYRNTGSGLSHYPNPSSGFYEFGQGPLPFMWRWVAHSYSVGGKPAFSFFLPPGTYETISNGAQTPWRHPTDAYVVVSGKYYA